MKLQIDTDKKTIKIEEKINLGELIDKLSMLFPNDLYKEYSIESTNITNWVNPIYIQPYQTIWDRPYYNNFEVYCGTTNSSNMIGVTHLHSSNTGSSFCLDLK